MVESFAVDLDIKICSCFIILGVRSLANASRARQFNRLNTPGMGWVKKFSFFKVRAVLARFCPPGINRAAEILSARAAEIPFAPSFSPMGRSCFKLFTYTALFYALAVDRVLSSLHYQLVDPSGGLCTINVQRR